VNAAPDSFSQPLTTEELRLKQAEDEVVQLIKRRKQVLAPPPLPHSFQSFHTPFLFSLQYLLFLQFRS
jgi:hypothetical protein